MENSNPNFHVVDRTVAVVNENLTFVREVWNDGAVEYFMYSGVGNTATYFVLGGKIYWSYQTGEFSS